MDERRLDDLLNEVRQGTKTVEEAKLILRRMPYEQVEEYARIDHHRALRCGFPEVIFAQGKTPRQVVQIMERSMDRRIK